MTLDGTNTWVVSAPGSDEAVVVDPGPDDPRHLAAVARTVAAVGARVSLILLTHGHHDHSAGAATFAAQVGAPVRSWDPRHRTGPSGLTAGESITAGGLEIDVIATPGHTSDSVTFGIPGGLLTGDTVLGRGTTVVAHPDGRLSDYLSSLRALRGLVAEADSGFLLPGHGPAAPNPGSMIDAYLAHREQRLDQITAALARLDPADLSEDELTKRVVETVYADVPREVWPAAAASVRAQLVYLLDPITTEETENR
jgi:glyoxylase-like metal-dependent hydrolase (beta-lactamase superfamily II)